MFTVDTVLMPVPLRLASAVADYVAALEAGRSAPVDVVPPSGQEAEPGASSPAVVMIEGHLWTEEMLRRMVDNLPYAGVVALFDACADEPGRWVPKSEAEKRLGITPIQLRNELGALSKLAKRLFGELTWPVEVKKEQGVYYYRMQEQVAEWWHGSRGIR